MKLYLTHPYRWLSALVLLALVGAVAVCEWRGWPFLERPAERWLGQRLTRQVDFEDGSGGHRFRLHLLGTLRFEASRLRIDNPAWSARQPMLLADDAHLALRWRDLLALRRGEPLRVAALSADQLQLQLERRADGQASWQFGQRGSASDEPKFAGVHFDRLAVRQGAVRLDDALMKVDLDAKLSLQEGAVHAEDGIPRGLVGSATGHYRGQPMQASLRAGSALAGLTTGAQAQTVPVELKVDAGASHLHFDGTMTDLLGERRRLSGSYKVSGPSLAAVGQAFNITLPTTHAFSMQGSLQHEGTRWTSTVERAQVGRSLLAGEFVFDTPPDRLPRLTGQLRGPLLWLEDLGPAVGLPAEGRAPKAQRPPGARVLPDRKFDLPSLRQMEADVAVALDRLEPGGSRLRAIAPLRGRLRLAEGVLNIDDLYAQWAQGRVQGRIQVDGREPVARWEAHLTGGGLLLEQWLNLSRPEGKPPYVSGRLGGRVDISGRGRSTAEFLASADGRAVLHWTRGSISHLVVEAAGIDIAQALGVMIKGDDALPVSCGAADLRVRDGRVTPQVLLVDTRDSTLWGEGTLSLADERLALVARVAPKDFSPLALRTPLHVDGTLGAPKVSIEKGPLARRLVPAALLAMLNPLAGLLPMIDPGDEADAQAALAGCRALAGQRQPAPRADTDGRAAARAPQTTRSGPT